MSRFFSSWAKQFTKSIINLMITLGVVSLLVAGAQEPSGIPLGAAFQSFKFYGFLGILVAFFVLLFQWGNDKTRLVVRLRFIAYALVIYALLLYSLGEFGEWLSTTWIAQLSLSAAATGSIAAVFAVFYVAVVMSEPSIYIPRGRRPSELERRHTAYHEAAHALCLAALGRVPVNARAVVETEVIDGEVAGKVRWNYSSGGDELFDADWRMITLLAGKVGEVRSLGAFTLGAESDYLKWQALARQYLSNQSLGVYFVEPQNQFEQSTNIEMLQGLERQQTQLIYQLLDLNHAVLHEMAEALLAKRVLERSEMIPFLARVTLPDGFPRPFGNFAVFSQD
jgi:hypothetical protein